MAIGKKIRKARKLRNMNQEDLGNLIGLPGDRIRQYENDVRNPKADMLKKISDALNVNIDALSEPDISSHAKVMQLLFDLEDEYGLHVEKIGDQYYLSFENNGSDIYSNQFYDRLKTWYEQQQRYKLTHQDSKDDIKNKKDTYNAWRMRYPLDE